MKTKLSSVIMPVLSVCAVFVLVCTGLAQNTGFSGFRGGGGFNQPVDNSLTAIAGQDRVVMQNGKTYLNGYAGYGQPV